MKKLIVLIFVCGLFDKIPWVRRIKNRYVEKLWLDYEVALKFTSVTIKNWHSIQIRGLYVRFKKHHVEVEANLASVSARSKVFTIDSLCIRLQKSSMGSGVAQTIEPDENSKAHQPWESKYYPVFKKAMRVIFRSFNHKVSVNEMVICNNQGQLPVAARSVTIKDNTFSLDVRISAKYYAGMYHVTGQRNPETHVVTAEILPIPASPDLLPLFQKLQVAFREERDKVNNGSRLNLSLEASNLYVNSKKVCSAPFTISSTELELIIDFNKDQFVITDESGGVIDDIPFTLSVSHETKESDLLRVSFYSDPDFDSLVKSFPFLAANTTPNCSITGNLMIRCRLMFVIDKAQEHFSTSKYWRTMFRLNMLPIMSFHGYIQPHWRRSLN